MFRRNMSPPSIHCLDCLLPSFTLVSCSAYSSTLKIEAIYSSKSSVDSQWTTWHYIPEDNYILSYWRLTFPNFEICKQILLQVSISRLAENPSCGSQVVTCTKNTERPERSMFTAYRSYMISELLLPIPVNVQEIRAAGTAAPFPSSFPGQAPVGNLFFFFGKRMSCMQKYRYPHETRRATISPDSQSSSATGIYSAWSSY
jgi:hypothetical protein